MASPISVVAAVRGGASQDELPLMPACTNPEYFAQVES
jgi:hypothetical protein